MKVSIDSSRCHGHARCYAFARETFVFDNEGFSSVREGYEEVKPELQEGVRRAFANCPENAISISDE